MKLHDLRSAEGARHRRKRVGRGISAGQGKTAGRGQKGQGARRGSGGNVYREGGNLPFVRKLPFKRGFTNINKIYYVAVNVDDLEDRFEANEVVTPESLASVGFAKSADDGPFALLGRGEITKPLNIKVHRCTASAKEKVEKAGGTVEILEA